MLLFVSGWFLNKHYLIDILAWSGVISSLLQCYFYDKSYGMAFTNRLANFLWHLFGEGGESKV